MPTTAEVNAAAENFIADTETADAKINGAAGDVTDRHGNTTPNLEKILLGVPNASADKLAAEAAQAAAEQALVDIREATSAGVAVALVNIAGLIAEPLTTNKFNHAISDVAAPSGDAAPAIGTTTANQLARIRSNTTGLLSAPSTAGSGWSWWASRKSPMLQPSTTYTMSIHGAPGGAYFYTNGFLQFFNADGTLHSYIDSGFTVSPAGTPREITFTTPAAAVSVAPNMRNVSEFSADLPATAEHVDLVAAATMINEGSSAAEFVPYSDGTFTPASDDLDPADVGAIVVAKQGVNYYVRAAAQMSPNKDVVWKLMVNSGVNYFGVDNRNGVVNFRGIRFIDKATAPASTIAAYNQSTDVHSLGFDESCPIKINSMYLAGSHAVIGREATMTTHGKANVDVGSIWSDGARQWVLHYIDSANAATFVAEFAGADDKWTPYTGDFAGATLTHVSGATNTADFTVASSEQSQSAPSVKEHLAEFRVDNTAISADGVYHGQRATLAETYALMNVRAQQDYLIANVGASDPDYDNAAIQNQIRFGYVFEWNRWGAMSVRAGHGVKDAYRRSASTDYWGAIQMQRLALAGDSTAGMHNAVELYIPGASNIAGSNYQSMVDITANAGEVRFAKADLDDPADPASHFALIGKASSVVKSGHLFGYSREVGLGVPATRAAKVNEVLFFSSAEKQYPIAIDSAAGDAAVGDADLVTAFRAPFLPTDTDLTIPGVVVTMDGEDYVYVTSHQSLANKAVVLPAGLSGKPITVVKSHPNVTINNTFASGGEISVTVANGYGDIILKVG